MRSTYAGTGRGQLGGVLAGAGLLQLRGIVVVVVPAAAAAAVLLTVVAAAAATAVDVVVGAAHTLKWSLGVCYVLCLVYE